VPRRETDALGRHEIEEWIVRLGEVLVHRADDIRVGLRSRDPQHARMALEDALGLRPETARDDDATVLLQRLADRLERFIHGGVDEAAGIDHDQVGGRVRRGHLIALGAQPREDALGVHERLGTAETDESDSRGAAGHSRSALSAVTVY